MGNDFIINVKVGFEADIIQHIHQTVDYGHLLVIITNIFNKPTELLETLACVITEEIKIAYPFITYTNISIEKKNPPLPAAIKGSIVMVEKNY